MTNSEAKEIIIKERDSLKANPMIKVEDCLYEALDLAIKALEQQPCEDCISREAVLEILEKEEFKGDAIYEIEKKLPSVTPTRPTGKWIVCDVVKFGDFVGTEKYECSKCHHRVGAFKSNFCPNCGAKMNGVETEVEDER